ncbi:MAG TPA: hypothetical protein ENI58_01345 [Nitrospirae bacterium]|nr:hypothetical protein [Nitrospirota bacterium]
MRRPDIFRAILYSILSFLVIITAYIYLNNRGEIGSGEPLPPKQETLRETVGSGDQESEAPGTSEEPSSALLPQNELTPSKEDEGREIVQRAVKSFNAGNYEGAIELIKGLSDRDSQALLTIGLSYYKLGNYGNAISFLEEAAEKNGKDFLARKFLAFAYYRQDNLDRSLSNAEAGLSVKEDPALRKLYDRVRKEMDRRKDYVKEETLHFKVLFNGYEHGSLSREILGILEDAYRSIGQEMNYFPSNPVTVILYTKKNFFDITQVPGWSGGIYDGKIRIPVKGLRGNEGVLRRVLFHEYTHAMIHSITRKCPQWINEGLADYFSGGYTKTVGQVIPLRSLEGSFLGFDRKIVGIAYRESYSAVSFLVERYGLYRMKEFLISLSEGKDLNQAFSSAFPMTYDEFVSTWGRGLG